MTESAAAKNTLRNRLLAARREMSAFQRDAASLGIAAHVGSLPEITRGTTIAAYVGVGTEPGTLDLLATLRRRGLRILLPVLRPDDDLDWAVYEGRDRLAAARLGLREPVGPRLGPEAVRQAGVVLAPGLAADRAGHRLGRGGGSYDRVLERLPQGTWVAVLLYGHEIMDRVPTDPHDRKVSAAITPEGAHRFDA